ncbi:hypothetical protein CASFOL_024389 [Castilleja foliolosa]|uniref:H15 domain-containing protein n=1 Tax=Castilleja foliolosa TaxID=1961234 RepID=A0ABD3CRQ6_9LAMI
MASEELDQPSAPKASLYPEMIMEAIEALNETNGSNKSSISKQMETTYGNLLPAHSTLLTHHLNRMRATGQLLFIKNNYLKPGPNAPPLRGRGRPPKPKAPLPQGIILPPPRPRGRPPKSQDPTSPPKPKAVSSTTTLSGRKRGRPPKASTGDAAPPSVTGGPPRGRGRPPKVKPVVAASVGA